VELATTGGTDLPPEPSGNDLPPPNTTAD
jgi:hypothetical protein